MFSLDFCAHKCSLPKQRQPSEKCSQRRSMHAGQRLVKLSRNSVSRNFGILRFRSPEISNMWRERGPETCTQLMRREREVWRWVCPNEAKSPSIYMQRCGWIYVTFGLLSLHKFAGQPWKFDHNQNKFITSFVHVKFGWSLDQSYTSRREESNKNISCHK